MSSIRGVYGPLRFTAIPVLCVVRKDDNGIPTEGVLKAITFGNSQCRSEEWGYQNPPQPHCCRETGRSGSDRTESDGFIILDEFVRRILRGIRKDVLRLGRRPSARQVRLHTTRARFFKIGFEPDRTPIRFAAEWVFARFAGSAPFDRGSPIPHPSGKTSATGRR